MSEPKRDKDIAVVGMACRFPGAGNYHSYWENLKNGVNAIKEIPEDRWDIDAYYSPKRNGRGKTISKWCGLLEDMDRFDHSFFNISKKEAAALDPHQRLLLEETWHCIEDSGIPLKELQKKDTSVYVGAYTNDHVEKRAELSVTPDGYQAIGGDLCMFANRLSYYFGLKGESFAIDAACASSLVALHEAKEALTSHRSEYALLGGVSLHFHHRKYVVFSAIGALSPTGRCKTFDKDANGYVPGDGVGMLLLQPLDAAVQAGHHIYGVIKGSAVNHGGRANGVTAPNVNAQKEVILKAYQDADLSPETVTYIEAHGTGTSLGDPIEIEALKRAFESHTRDRQYCTIGSVKTNIGHLEAAAGVAGIIKVLLMMKARKIPAILNLTTLNPVIDFKHSPFKVTTTLEAWEAREKGMPLRCGVSSFGIGGANSHVVLESFEKMKTSPKPAIQHLPFIFSARSEKSLGVLMNDWQRFLGNDDVNAPLTDLSATLVSSRESFPFRFGCLAKDKRELISTLKKGDIKRILKKREKLPLCIGDISLNGDDDVQKIFKDAPFLRRSADLIIEELIERFPAGRRFKNFRKKVWSKTIQPLYSFIAGYTYISALMAAGLKPSVIKGSGTGFLIVTVISRMVPLKEMISALCKRGLQMPEILNRPTLPVVDPFSQRIIMPLSLDAGYLIELVRPCAIRPKVFESIVKKAQLLIKSQFTFKKFINEWNGSLHSGQSIEALLFNEALLDKGESISFKEKLEVLIPILSSLVRLNQKWNLSEDRSDLPGTIYELADLFVDGVLKKNDFATLLEAVPSQLIHLAEEMKAHQEKMDVEIKPYRHLKKRSQENFELNAKSSVFIKKAVKKEISLSLDERKNALVVGAFEGEVPKKKPFFASLKGAPLSTLTDTLLQLWLEGEAIQWEDLFPAGSFQKIPLPLYPFLGERHIQERGVFSSHSLSDNKKSSIFYENTSTLFTQRLTVTSGDKAFFLTDHQLNGEMVLPGVVYLEMVRAAALMAMGEACEDHLISLKNVTWIRPLVVKDLPMKIHIELYPEDDSGILFEVVSIGEGKEPVCHAQGGVITDRPESAPLSESFDFNEIFTTPGVGTDAYFKEIKRKGLLLGPGFRGLETAQFIKDGVLAKMNLPASVADTSHDFFLHPSIMDAAIQACLMLMTDFKDHQTMDGSGLCLPFFLEQLEILGPSLPVMWAHGRRIGNESSHTQSFNVDLCDENGKVHIRMKGLCLKSIENKAPEVTGSRVPDSPYPVPLLTPSWEAIPLSMKNRSAFDGHRHILIYEFEASVYNDIKGRFSDGVCHHLQSFEKTMGERFQTYALDLFQKIKEILKRKAEGPSLIQVMIPHTLESLMLKGLSGVLKTLQMEHPKMTAQLLLSDEIKGDCFDILNTSADLSAYSLIRYHNERYWHEGADAMDTPEKTVKKPWKKGGVYLITGGAGGLGRIFATEILKTQPEATLILVGRSLKDETTLDAFEEMVLPTQHIDYRRVDISDEDSCRKLIKDLVARYGALNGIIHSAGVISDNYILKKTSDEFRKVLAPKVRGTLALDAATQNLPLDFFVLFSSTSGAFGNPGQCDYASGNAFMDGFSEYRSCLVNAGKRHGKTLSINWPLWRSGGMRIHPHMETFMLKSTGLVAMETQTGVHAFYDAMAQGQFQVMVLHGDESIMRKKLLPKGVNGADNKKSIALVHAEGSQPENLRERVIQMLKVSASDILKMAPDEIDASDEFIQHGFDSISLTEFSNALNSELQLDLTPPVFFEYPSMELFADYLINNHAELFKETEVMEPKKMKAFSPPDIPIPKPLKPYRRFQKSSYSPPSETLTTDDPVAIIGVSGIFPKARDVNTFWENLLAEKSCIEEIPKDRWDWEKIWGDPSKTPNTSNVKWGGFIDSPYDFDPLYFGISPREAERMDPQHRLLMTYAIKAIEDAGYSPKSLSGTNTAIYVGTTMSGYDAIISSAEHPIEGYTATGMYASVGPNRLSYFLNVNGPSEPIETACSSSLVAVVRAVTAIKNGTCDMAIVGGVNTLLSPKVHISFNKAGMLSVDGKCKTFSDQANGYVRGEGAGMLVLKRLSHAKKAKDPIYAVIRGSGENHGGRASSLTAPNPNAQAALLKCVYEKEGIDPNTISYIEAHGTGTPLGDPIEMNALKSAFKDLYQQNGIIIKGGPACGVGSVKTHIGHLEFAAGVAGIIKVLMQMKHKTLVKTLHCNQLNPYIDLKDSPFYIVRKTQPWEPLKDLSGDPIPRRAGVSSFGFGGVNAHVVLEEYVDTKTSATIPLSKNPPHIFPLSSKSEGQLKVLAGEMVHALNGLTDQDLPEIACTLQVGRDAMPFRLGIIASSMDDLKYLLNAYLKGEEKKEGLFYLKGRAHQSPLSFIDADEDMETVVDAFFKKKKYSQLLNLWINGLNVDWNKCYGETRPRRINLPSSPFQAERFYIQGSPDNFLRSKENGQGALLHPLIHQNTSDFWQQRFTTWFKGDEFFLIDHVIQKKRVLPGVASLEMAREAIFRAMGVMDEDLSIQLKNVVWLNPMIHDGAIIPIHTELSLFKEHKVLWKIVEGSDEHELIHSEGSAEVMQVKTQPMRDIAAIRSSCSGKMLTSDECYDVFKSFGMEYGSRLQGIETIYAGSDVLLAKLRLPERIADTKEAFTLHPTLMDASLQASIGFVMGSKSFSEKSERVPFIPFSLEQLDIFNGNMIPLWAIIQFSSPAASSREQNKKWDIDLVDASGGVCVRIKGVFFREMKSKNLGIPKSPPRLKSTSESEHPRSVINETDLSEKIKTLISKELSLLLKVKAEDMDGDIELSEYGLDSIMLTQFTNTLNDQFKLELTPPIFFEYPTLRQLSDYLKRSHGDRFVNDTGGLKNKTAAPFIPKEQKKSPEIKRQKRFGIMGSSHVFSKERTVQEPVAIIGMSGRFPKAENLDVFWENLEKGRDCIDLVPEDRWDWKALYGDPKKEENVTNVKWGGFMDDIFDFDPLFFGISPKEANLMDPQQRLMMTYIYKAIEDAGHSAKSLSGSHTAIFMGTSMSGYGSLTHGCGEIIEGYSATSLVPSVGPNRMSYFLNIHGPSEPVETACSSSLVAIHKGVELIRNGTSDMAIVGGVNTILTPDFHIGFNKAGMLSQDGRCKTFSKNANGYARGEGIGVLVLKRLSLAETERDHIYGVIRGTFENHGGRANSLTAPNMTAQAELIKTAYQQCGIDPQTVGYIEAHGTGTKLGDPVEVNALKSAFKDLYGDRNIPAKGADVTGLGSVKTNIGHLEIAAGAAGVIKLILQMKHQTLVKSLNTSPINPYIDLENSPFYIVDEKKRWDRVKGDDGNELPLRGGVSSFGFGGVNAHVIIEEYQEMPERRKTRAIDEKEDPDHIFVLSAKNEKRLKAYAGKMVAYLKQDSLYKMDMGLDDRVLSENLQNDLVRFVSDILKVDETDIDRSGQFSDFGLEPLNRTELIGQMNETYQLGLNISLFTEYGSIVSLGTFLMAAYKKNLLSYYLSQNPKRKKVKKCLIALEDIAYTLQTGREEMPCRLAFVANSHGALLKKLNGFLGKSSGDDSAIFTGNLNTTDSNMKHLFTGKVGARVVKMLLEENHPEKIARHWTQGGAIPWKDLYKEHQPIKVSLPTYPFEKRRCIFNRDLNTAEKESTVCASDHFKPALVKPALVKPSLVKSDPVKTEMAVSENSLDRQIVNIVSDTLGVTVEELSKERPLKEYGMDSILFIKMVGLFQQHIDAAISPITLKGCDTLDTMRDAILKESSERSFSAKRDVSAPSKREHAFPELIHLNQASKGQPIFWFHGGFGGVEVYEKIAMGILRPFYGIEARGWMTDRVPLFGIQAMASYYLHMIQTVMPDGPYQLGGFSLGGIIAYEVTRQLQELGETVNSLVMIDAIDLIETELANMTVNYKTAALQTINMALLNGESVDPGNLPKRLIHRNEVSPDLPEDDFLNRLFELGRQKGLNKTKDQLQMHIMQKIKIQKAFGLNEFSILPLMQPQSVRCTFFRNKSGRFWGELTPYFTIKGDKSPKNNAIYWNRWQQNLPHFKRIDIDAPNHIRMLSDPSSLKEISEVCQYHYHKASFKVKRYS